MAMDSEFIESEMIAFALYAWLAVSVLAFIIQFIRRRRYRPEEDSIADPPVMTRPTLSPPGAPSDDEAESEGDESAPLIVPTTRSVEPPAEEPDEVEGATVETEPVIDLAAESGNGQTASDTERAAVDPAKAERPTISALLGGVRLPCDLLPLDVGQSDYAVRFSTNGFPPIEVGTALADELERLGYEIHPLAEDEAVAKRVGTDGADKFLSLKIHDRPGDLVEVDIWVDAIPNPIESSDSATESMGK